ncbi:MAG TPA: cell envelope biogenesis protein TolA [Xanthobacteraceae bacterium]|nr:cell envelope biogenesis protein TolA [Xanthobacteraceae bacterium]
MEVRPGLAVSSIAHAVILGWGLLWFTPKALESKPIEAMPVDIVPISDITQNKAGAKTAKADKKPLVEKKADPKELKELVEKVSKQPEIKQAAAPPPPSEETKKEAAKPEEKQETKPEPKKEAVKKKPEPPKRPEKPKEHAKSSPNKMKAAPTKHEFDPNKIAALLDRRTPQRHEMSSLENPNQKPAPGFAKGQSAMLSQTEIDALRRRLAQCWNPPAGIADAGKLRVVIRVLFRRDGSVAAPPQTVAGPPSALGPAMAESAKRAILSCQPFTMLNPDHYEQWRDMEINFDPSEMLGG